MRILVTGGAGFIGSHLVKRLIRDGHAMVVVDNFSTGFRKNVDTKAELVEADVSQPDFLKKLPNGPYDAVCHLAAQSSGELSGKDPLYDLRANAASTLLLSRWCAEKRIGRFIYASSMAVYGNQTSLAVTENAACEPLSYYGISKLSSEHFLRLSERDGVRSTSFRMFSVYGPGQNLDNLKQGMVSIYLAYLLKGIPIPVTGSLERIRDFIYIDDVVDAWTAALLRSATPSLVYNLGTGQPTRVKELLEHLFSAFGLKSHPIEQQPGYASDQHGLIADVGRLKKELKWSPKILLREGLKEMVKWARE